MLACRVHTRLPVWQDGSIKTGYATMCVFAVGNILLRCQGTVLEYFCPRDSGWFETVSNPDSKTIRTWLPQAVGGQALFLGQKAIP